MYCIYHRFYNMISSDIILIYSSIRTVQKYMKQYKILTTRKNGLSAEDQGAAILKVTEDDPLGRWGGRLVKEKLASEGIHISR